MFKFNFSADNSIEEDAKSMVSDDQNIRNETYLEVIPHDNADKYSFKALSVENFTFRIRDLDSILGTNDSNFLNSYKACDIIPTIYEGGLKVWECTYDLLIFLIQNHTDFSQKTVLDLGCGSGLLGIYAGLKNATTVHFQDYNANVLRSFTIPNTKSNKLTSNTKFFCGDWNSFVLRNPSNELYDYILCSEILYNTNNYYKLVNLFKRKLHPDGKVIIASKSYYFGVGGSVQQFKDFLSHLKNFSWQTVWKTTEGVQREILIIKKLNDQNLGA